MRGQTSIDFLVGMSVFLLTVAFVFATLPNTFAPFTGDDSSELLGTDRVASHLTEGTLAQQNRPGVLNGTCTEQFFGTSGACHPSNLNAALGVGANERVNVTIESSGAIRDIGGTQLSAGPTTPTNGSVVVASRLVSIDGEEYELYVRTW
ncbi:hypothetical protein ACFFQF_15160 [Haladaptatus pallidirubidus]|uniref:Uncharacterized protein n=1 Tax=Haladaptatus pallidirubidus TaxID=1008152 RepID=A0AAV3UCZ6_9EURY|nr:hypothetical protein [Haladaptatus pallidirubidus]